MMDRGIKAGLIALVAIFSAPSAAQTVYEVGPFQIQAQKEWVRAGKGNAEALSFSAKDWRLERGNNRALERYGTFQITESSPALTCTWRSWKSSVQTSEELIFHGQVEGPKACPQEVRLVFSSPSKNQLTFRWETGLESEEGYRSSMSIRSFPEENFLGLGTQYTHLLLKGHKVPILAQEQGHGRGLQPISFLQSIFTPGLQGTPYSTYAPSSFFLSTKHRAFFFPHYEYGEVDFTREQTVKVKYWSSSLEGELTLADSPGELVTLHTERIGRQKLPPDWAHQGAILGVMGGTDKVLKLREELESRGAPIAAWWLQDWAGVRQTTMALRLNWNWQLDESRYPGWQELVQTLHTREERVLGYLNPYISPAVAVRPPQRHLFEEARDLGYLVLHPSGRLYEVEMGGFKAYLIDLFNPEARQWLKSIMEYKVSQVGLSGWMLDFGEAFPFDGVVQSDLPRPELHHRYVEEWIKLNHEFTQEIEGGEDLLVFSRAGFHGSQKYSSMYWVGDQSTTWDQMDGLKTALISLLSSGLSGWQFNHSDIGGYFGVRIPALLRIGRSPELLYRWTEMNAFTSLFRTHEGLNPHLNFQFYSHEASYDFFAKFARVFAELFPYRQQVFQEARATGWPAVRHLYLQHPEDPVTLKIEDQFFLGEDLLVAPVLDEGARSRRVYLPEGDWTHLWSGKNYQAEEGLWITQSAPWGEPPVYFRSANRVLESISENLRARASFAP